MTAGLIFDYGGTLDTGGQHWGQALWHAYERHRVPVTEAEFREAYVHTERTLGRNPVIGPDFTFRQTLETKLRLQLDFLEPRCEGVGQYAQMLLDDLYEKTQAETARSRQVLTAIKECGLPMVLVSNFYGNMSVVLREFGFEGLFLHVIESAVVGIRKPDPRIFLLGVVALGLRPEQVMVVGDSLDKDIIPASEAGCQTVWLRGEGWNANARTVDEGEDSRFYAVIDSLDELLEMIKTK
jgi:putative hydrolase of the HAD superfamily